MEAAIFFQNFGNYSQITAHSYLSRHDIYLMNISKTRNHTK